MYLFYDSTLNTWRLITEKLPEKPCACHPMCKYPFQENGNCRQRSGIGEEKFNAAIATLKQNALTVGNQDIVKEKLDSLKWVGRIDKADVYEWPGNYETKEIDLLENGYIVGIETVAILTLPEEKKNTMENIDEKIAKILRDNITFSGQLGDYVIHGAIDKIIEHFGQQLKDREELIKVLLQLTEQPERLTQECILSYSEVKFCHIRNGEGNTCRHCIDKNLFRRAKALLDKQ